MNIQKGLREMLEKLRYRMINGQDKGNQFPICLRARLQHELRPIAFMPLARSNLGNIA